MINSINYRRAMGVAVAIVLGPQAFGQVSFSNSAGLAYSQNFNGLTTVTAPATTWANGNTAGLSSGSSPSSTAGWYAWRATANNAPTTYTASAGTSTAGLYSFGSSGNSDRALGAYLNDTSGAYYIGLYLRYTGTGVLPSLSQLQVIYRGEVWQDAGSEANTMTFEYQISASPIAINAASGWSAAVTQLGYTYTGDGTSSTEVGNNSGNFVQRNHLISGITIADDNYIMLRWTIPNTTGADHAFAIDDVFIAVPEAGTWTAGALMGAAALVGYRRSRRTLA